MSNYPASQRWFDEAPLRRAYKPANHIRVQVDDLNFDSIPDDAYEGMEYYNHIHLCWLCHEQGHEDEMVRNLAGYWVHARCEVEQRQFIKNLKL